MKLSVCIINLIKAKNDAEFLLAQDELDRMFLVMETELNQLRIECQELKTINARLKNAFVFIDSSSAVQEFKTDGQPENLQKAEPLYLPVEHNVGRRWNSIDEQKLLVDFDMGISVDDLAKSFGRTRGGIEDRLAMHKRFEKERSISVITPPPAKKVTKNTVVPNDLSVVKNNDITKVKNEIISDFNNSILIPNLAKKYNFDDVAIIKLLLENRLGKKVFDQVEKLYKLDSLTAKVKYRYPVKLDKKSKSFKADKQFMKSNGYSWVFENETWYPSNYLKSIGR